MELFNYSCLLIPTNSSPSHKATQDSSLIAQSASVAHCCASPQLLTLALAYHPIFLFSSTILSSLPFLFFVSCCCYTSFFLPLLLSLLQFFLIFVSTLLCHCDTTPKGFACRSASRTINFAHANWHGSTLKTMIGTIFCTWLKFFITIEFKVYVIIN